MERIHKAELLDMEREMEEMRKRIKELEDKLRQLQRSSAGSDDAISKLKEALEKERGDNRALLLSNEQLRQLAERSGQGLADQAAALNAELAEARARADELAARLKELEGVKKSLEEELERLRKMSKSNADGDETELG